MLSKNILAVAAAIVPAFAQEETEPQNLTALIGSDDRLSTLGTILESYPNVAEALGSAENVTVLAPTNEAFQTFLDSAGLSLEDVTEDQVQAILNYHVIAGQILSENITETPAFAPTLLDNATYVSQRLRASFYTKIANRELVERYRWSGCWMPSQRRRGHHYLWFEVRGNCC